MVPRINEAFSHNRRSKRKNSDNLPQLFRQASKSKSSKLKVIHCVPFLTFFPYRRSRHKRRSKHPSQKLFICIPCNKTELFVFFYCDLRWRSIETFFLPCDPCPPLLACMKLNDCVLIVAAPFSPLENGRKMCFSVHVDISRMFLSLLIRWLHV